jgi:hypothetical protein
VLELGTHAAPDLTKTSSSPVWSEKYSKENLRRFAEQFKVRVEDRRDKGGGLWVVMDDLPEARRVLDAWGFRYAAGKGWWKKDG